MTRGERVVAFIQRYCRVPEGEHVGSEIVLDEFQVKFICDVYDNPHVTRRAFLSVARKNGKTAIIAGILLAHLVGPEAVLNTQIVSGALSRDQAALVFALAVKMIQMSPELTKLTRIVPSSKRLIGLSRNVEFRALSADGRTAHGLSPVLAILDEVGQIRGPQSDFVDAITTSQGAHAAPLLIAISTQAPNDADLFSIWIDDAAASGDPRIVSHIYAAPADCKMDDPAAWLAANPAMGKFRSVSDLKEQAERALRMPSSEPTFRNLMLNQRVEMSAPFITRTVWESCGAKVNDEVFARMPCWVGLDLSGKTDLTSMVVVAYDGTWHVKAYFWTPANGLSDRAKRDRAPYPTWVEQGYITAIPGASIDYEVVAKNVVEILSEFDVQGVAFDRWRFDILKKELDELGFEAELVPFGQGFKDMAPAIDRVEEVLLNGQMLHGSNPVLTMCMANSLVVKDPAGNRKLDKAKATGRIDGAIALTMALGLAAKTEMLADIDEFLNSPAIL